MSRPCTRDGANVFTEGEEGYRKAVDKDRAEIVSPVKTHAGQVFSSKAPVGPASTTSFAAQGHLTDLIRAMGLII
ncbi:hypothetical protein BDM02DRAFT_3122229 [Thelephora ganbajun]|uniref:Uncharacterized protein n=1 Tax=Thelephora ganbajun TaxID=370292 RepID=A0ACB6Z3K8_THEGA|nr:hypothetical protein BDM02DRAFT_3122229 [Thelephora ganbajun]